MTGDGMDIEDRMEVVARRVEFIDLLRAEGPLETRDIVDALDHSRSTVTRALRALREADLIEKTADGYVPILPSVLAAEQYRRYETASKAILAANELLAPIPEPHAPPVDLLVGANMIRADAEIPVRPFEAVSDRIRTADTVRAYLPTLVNTHLLRVWHRAVVAEAVDGAAVFNPALLTVLKGQYPRLLSEMAATGGFSAFATAGPPYSLVCITTGDTTTVAVIVYEAGTARGVIVNDSAAAVEWARGEFERLESEATDVTADLTALSVVLADGNPELGGSTQTRPGEVDDDGAATGHALPLDLEMEGFVRLSPEYFDTHSQASPAVSWRTGFTLAEVWAGHAVDRLDDDGRNLTDELVKRLRTGENHVLLGPPGSGKSTVCMAVACTWYERGLGPVLYRERGSGDHFASAALLEAYLRQTDEHTLVVVEDSVREQATAVFDVMRALDNYRPVTFLLDARAHEWRDADTVAVDARRDAYRRTAVNQVDVPALDERECARFVAHFGDLVDAPIDLSGTELFALVEEGTTVADEEDDARAGDVLVAQHHLSRRYDPLVDVDAPPPTALDEAVRRTYRTLTDAGARFAPDLAMAINLLNAAGLPIAVEYLYALASENEYAALEEELSLLDGHLLFAPAHPRAGAPATYRTRHETWSLRFLEQIHAVEPSGHARDRFGRCVTKVLALADAPEQRHRMKQHLSGRTPHLHQIEADPGHWADETAARLFGVGRTNANLAPLFGETTDDTIELPTACSAWTNVQQAYWRGEMNRRHGDLDRAEREFQTLGELADTVEIPDETALRPTTPLGDSDLTSIHEVVSDGESVETAQRQRWRARSHINLGEVARERGAFETAAEHLDEGLARCREVGDRHGEARALLGLGLVAMDRGAFETAAEHLDEGLARCREVDDPHNEALILLVLGTVANRPGKLEAAEAHYEESLALCREIGDRRNEARVLLGLGVVASKRGKLGTAEEYYGESLALCREVGDRRFEARTLLNLGDLSRRRSELETADEYFRESLALCREVGDRRFEARSRAGLGTVARKRGELETAEAHYEQSLAILPEVGDHHGEAEVLLDLGRTARDREEIEQARVRFEAAADRFVEIGAREASTALVAAIDACERQGDVDAALEWCQRASEFAERTDRPELLEEVSARRADLVDGDEYDTPGVWTQEGTNSG